MRRSMMFFLSLFTGFVQAYADPLPAGDQVIQTPPSVPFQAFTGKVIKNKVRLRQQPNLDSPVLRELNLGDLLIVVGETDDFYAVQPPSDVKAYVFRTYILDNVVEANRVNVRLEPDVDAPVIGQLASGDRVQGTISALNSKWLEINPPSTTHFFVAKDYIEKLGDPGLMAKIEKRREEVNLLLNSTYLSSQNEMQKPFPDMNMEPVVANYNKIVAAYSDFPEQVARARELLASLQDHLLKKKIAYLEDKTKNTTNDWQSKNSQLNAQIQLQQQQLSHMEKELGKAPTAVNPFAISTKMAMWLPIEQDVYNRWAAQNGNRSQDEFYVEQNHQAITLSGILEPYTRVINNRPGDYVLVHQSNHLPVAFLYSTHVNLQDKVGQNITVRVVGRPNNNFAFPAFFVLSIE